MEAWEDPILSIVAQRYMRAEIVEAVKCHIQLFERIEKRLEKDDRNLLYLIHELGIPARQVAGLESGKISFKELKIGRVQNLARMLKIQMVDLMLIISNCY